MHTTPRPRAEADEFSRTREAQPSIHSRTTIFESITSSIWNRPRSVRRVHLPKPNKDAVGYVDGGYAGAVGKLQSLHLRPGAYDIELRAQWAAPYNGKIYVVAGKAFTSIPLGPISRSH